MLGAKGLPSTCSAPKYPPPGEGCTIGNPSGSPPPSDDSIRTKRKVFLEIFAGKGGLSATLREVSGIHVLPPDEFKWGGTDFTKSSAANGLNIWIEMAMAVAKEQGEK